MSEIKILFLPDVQQRVGIGKTKIYELIKHNEFPKNFPFHGRKAWDSRDIDAWILQEIEKGKKAA